jgi:hypothetical protein
MRRMARSDRSLNDYRIDKFSHPDAAPAEAAGRQLSNLFLVRVLRDGQRSNGETKGFICEANSKDRLLKGSDRDLDTAELRPPI